MQSVGCPAAACELDGRTLLMQRYTEPQEDQKLLLAHLKLELPPQKPPKIYRGQLKK
jgi:hypothetical protein